VGASPGERGRRAGPAGLEATAELASVSAPVVAAISHLDAVRR